MLCARDYGRVKLWNGWKRENAAWRTLSFAEETYWVLVNIETRYCAFQKFVESLARPSNCCAAPPNCGVETDSMNSRRIAVVRALYYSILLAETSPSLLIIEKYGVEWQ
jgi:hypothetical protein